MFGLMKPRGKAPASLPSQHQRLHYCGVCKAMGRQYGQRTRVMLNYDAVFLAELLTFLNPLPESYTREWSPALLSYNCLRLPETQDIPLPLRYAAAVNVLLAGIKLDDNVQDRGGFVWRTAGMLYQERVAKAEKDLTGYGLDLHHINHWLRVHQEREKRALIGHPARHLNHLAEATSQITGRIFRQGAIAVEAERQSGEMEKLGRDFGRMIYLLDAYRDYEKDAQKGEYNPIRVAFGEAKDLSEEVKGALRKDLLQTAGRMIRNLEATEIRRDGQIWLKKRLEENLKDQLGITEEEFKTCATSSPRKPRGKISLRARFRFAKGIARTWKSPEIARRNQAWRQWTAFAAVGGLALLVPGFLHAKADWFSHVDPDFVGRLGDLHPDWNSNVLLVAKGECGDSNCLEMCCGECGDNVTEWTNQNCFKSKDPSCYCASECNRQCNNTMINCCSCSVILTTFILIRRRFNLKRKALENIDNIFNKRLRVVVERPGIDAETLRAASQNWFKKYLPNAKPELVHLRGYDVLEGFMEIRNKVDKDGNGDNLGLIRLRVNIYFMAGYLAFEFDKFEHLGGPGCPAGGDMRKKSPEKLEPPLSVESWRTMKVSVYRAIERYLHEFPSQV